jgi:opacity protein-like surface antigen
MGGGLGVLINRSNIQDYDIYGKKKTSFANQNTYQNTASLVELFFGYIKKVNRVGLGVELSGRYHGFHQNYGSAMYKNAAGKQAISERECRSGIGMAGDVILGFYITSQNFLYGTIGCGLDRFDYQFEDTDNSLFADHGISSFKEGKNDTKKFFSIGLGLDHALTNKLKCGIKIRYISYGDTSFVLPGKSPGPTYDTYCNVEFNEKSNAVSISVRVAYTF